MFAAAVMAGVSRMALAVTGFIGMEMIERTLATLRHGPRVPMTWVEAVIHMAIEASRPVEPRSRSDEHATAEPIGAVIAVRSTAVGCVIEISVGTSGRSIHAN
jgi:hypothetical protein